MPVRRKAYSYSRFSRPEQSRGASRRRQSEAPAAYAAEHDLDLDDSLRDEGVSAYKGKHRQSKFALGRFLDKVDAGEIAPGSVLLVESFDRLSREQVLDALELFLALLNAGIELVTLIDGRSYTRASIGSDPTQLIISIVIMSRAYEESATKGRRVADAWRRKREAARTSRQAMTARAPGWVKLVGGPRTGRYEAIPDRAEIVREIFSATIAGDGRRTIAKRLNASGVPTWGVGKKRGVQWHDSYVAKILTSPAAFGACSIDGEEVKGYFPAAVDEDTFWKAQASTSGRAKAKGRTSPGFKNLLRGLATCPSCRGSMTYSDKGSKSPPALVCSNAHAAAGCSNRARVPYKLLDRTLCFAFAHFADKATFALDQEARQAEADLAAAEKRREALLGRRANLIEAIESGIRITGLMARSDALQVEIDAVEREIAGAKRARSEGEELFDDIEDRIAIIEAKVFNADPIERYRGRSEINARLRHYLDRIVVEPGPRLIYEIKPEFEGITDEMVAAYGPKPRDGQPQDPDR